MAPGVAGRWAQGSSDLEIPVEATWTFAWIVPKYKVKAEDAAPRSVPGTSTMLGHSVEYTCFGDISDRLQFLDLDPARGTHLPRCFRLLRNVNYMAAHLRPESMRQDQTALCSRFGQVPGRFLGVNVAAECQ